MHYDDELFDEEKEISIDELVEALSGEDEDGDPKSVVECSLYKVETTEDGTLEKINEMTSFTAAPGVFGLVGQIKGYLYGNYILSAGTWIYLCKYPVWHPLWSNDTGYR